MRRVVCREERYTLWGSLKTLISKQRGTGLVALKALHVTERTEFQYRSYMVHIQSIKDGPLRSSECITAQGLKYLRCMTAFTLHCRRVVVAEEMEEEEEELMLGQGRP